MGPKNCLARESWQICHKHQCSSVICIASKQINPSESSNPAHSETSGSSACRQAAASIWTQAGPWCRPRWWARLLQRDRTSAAPGPSERLPPVQCCKLMGFLGSSSLFFRLPRIACETTCHCTAILYKSAGCTSHKFRKVFKRGWELSGKESPMKASWKLSMLPGKTPRVICGLWKLRPLSSLVRSNMGIASEIIEVAATRASSSQCWQTQRLNFFMFSLGSKFCSSARLKNSTARKNLNLHEWTMLSLLQ